MRSRIMRKGNTTYNFGMPISDPKDETDFICDVDITETLDPVRELERSTFYSLMRTGEIDKLVEM